VRFTDDGMNAAGTYYIMRPEAVEALFYMWRLTKDPKWREYGWKIFQAINKHCKADAGYTYALLTLLLRFLFCTLIQVQWHPRRDGEER
jgi:hypothetical protein